MFEFRGKVRSYGDMQRMFADPQALHPLLSSLQVGKSAKINGDRITRLPDSDAEQQSTIAAQAAEIKRLREVETKYFDLCHDVARAAMRDHESKDLWQMIADFGIEVKEDAQD